MIARNLEICQLRTNDLVLGSYHWTVTFPTRMILSSNGCAGHTVLRTSGESAYYFIRNNVGETAHATLSRGFANRETVTDRKEIIP